MGKNLIIKGADFSQNCIVDEDPTRNFIQGYIGPTNSTSAQYTVINCLVPEGFNTSQPNTIKLLVMFVKNKYNADLLNENATIYVPSSLYYSYAAVSADLKTSVRLSGNYLAGGVNITKTDIYTGLQVNDSDYPYYSVILSKRASVVVSNPTLTPEEAIEAGAYISFQ